jgi:hypothetical protein
VVQERLLQVQDLWPGRALRYRTNHHFITSRLARTSSEEPPSHAATPQTKQSQGPSAVVDAPAADRRTRNEGVRQQGHRIITVIIISIAAEPNKQPRRVALTFHHCG